MGNNNKKQGFKQESKQEESLQTFEEIIKRLLETPPKKQSEIKGNKKDK